MIKQIKTTIADLRKLKPLVLCLTNYVTMDFMANSLLALGAAPLMSVCDLEIEELIKISHAININIGTLDDDAIARYYKAVEFAKHYNKPLIIDPVGAGASAIRTNCARELMKDADIIRGNASEIMALLDDDIKTLGVESLNPTKQAKNKANMLANKFNCTVVVSGAEDFITDGARQESLTFGSPLMPLITGMGCALTAVIAAFRATIPDSFEAAKCATSYFGLCGNLANLKADKPATFRSAFIDELYAADIEDIAKISDLHKI
jgi:hydroxyethylthiazole kinase